MPSYLYFIHLSSSIFISLRGSLIAATSTLRRVACGRCNSSHGLLLFFAVPFSPSNQAAAVPCYSLRAIPHTPSPPPPRRNPLCSRPFHRRVRSSHAFCLRAIILFSARERRDPAEEKRSRGRANTSLGQQRKTSS